MEISMKSREIAPAVENICRVAHKKDLYRDSARTDVPWVFSDVDLFEKKQFCKNGNNVLFYTYKKNSGLLQRGDDTTR